MMSSGIGTTPAGAGPVETAQADIVYRPRGRVPGTAVGAHRGRDAGGLGTFRDQVPFLRMPDARRIDVRATLRDSIGQRLALCHACVLRELCLELSLSLTRRDRKSFDMIDP